MDDSVEVIHNGGSAQDELAPDEDMTQPAKPSFQLTILSAEHVPSKEVVWTLTVHPLALCSTSLPLVSLLSHFLCLPSLLVKLISVVRSIRCECERSSQHACTGASRLINTICMSTCMVAERRP